MAQAASTYFGEQRRRSTRLTQALPVIIRGVDLLGQPFEERTATQNLSFQGCRYASKHHLPKNTWVTLEAPSGDSRKEAVCVRARVAWIQRPRTLRELFQVGVELEKVRNIWNVAFPPSDWNSEQTVGLAVVGAPNVSTPAGADGGLSLEDYLRMAVAHVSGEDFLLNAAREATSSSDMLVARLREELLEQANKAVAEARTAAEELVNERAKELQNGLQTAHEESEEAFREQWLRAFERDRAGVREEIAAAVSQEVSAQFAVFEEQVKNTLDAERTDKLSSSPKQLSGWEADAQSLREEIRATAEATLSRSDDRLTEQLLEFRRELEASLGVNAGHPAKEEGAIDFPSGLKAAQAQWDELVESSLDSAAQRLAERIASGSQELLRKAGHELGSRVAELQKESGVATETSRSALEELRFALGREVAGAKESLRTIEHAAANYTEYSRQLEAASQDNLNQLQHRLEAAIAQRCAELEKRASELEGKLIEHTSDLLERQSEENVRRSAEAIESRATAALDRVARAAEALDGQTEQAEASVRMQRERLRQISEQVEREAATHAASTIENLKQGSIRAQEDALKHWRDRLAATVADSAAEASAQLRIEAGKSLAETTANLAERAKNAVDSAQENMNGAIESSCETARARLEKIETDELDRARGRFARAASEQLDSARSELTRAAEAAASTLGEMIAGTHAKALGEFSEAIEAKSEESRARLVLAGENVLQSVQSHAQSSFEHFQEQLAIKAEQATQRAAESLAQHFEFRIEELRVEGESALEEWSTKQRASAERVLARNQEELQGAAKATVESALELLEQRSSERLNTVTRATEGAVRQACVEVFEAVAQKMKEKLEGIGEIKPHPHMSETGQPEERASV